jgi:hypothetical protein
LKKHLGIWWEWRKDQFNETYLVATMPKMANEISAAYEAAKKKKARPAQTPAYPETT